MRSTIIPPVTEKPKFEMKYNDKTYQSYVKNGFIDGIPHRIQAPHNREQQWLNEVDLRKGPIERTVTRIIRVLATDYEAKQFKLKDYVYYIEDWRCLNWAGIPIIVSEHFEGIWYEQTKRPVFDEMVVAQGAESPIVGYDRGEELVRHDIPFSKKAVDDIITSSVGSNKDTIIFTFKVPPRRDNCLYDEFVNFSWEQAHDILMQTGGFDAARIKRKLEGQEKVLTANKLDFKPS